MQKNKCEWWEWINEKKLMKINKCKGIKVNELLQKNKCEWRRGINEND